MTGDNAAFGQDISQAAKIAVTDAGQFKGFSFELDAQDDGGTPEGGLLHVANSGDILAGLLTNAIIEIFEQLLERQGGQRRKAQVRLADDPAGGDGIGNRHHAQAGLPGFEVSVWQGLYVPKGTPKPVMEKITKALQTALANPTLMQRFVELGTIPASKEEATPEALRVRLKSEIDKWAPIIKKAGVYAD